MDFTASQNEAIEHANGNLQIIACAGSGKTEVVAQRVAHLLQDGWEDGLRPHSFVAFTFTEKAAAELKERISRRINDRLGRVHGMAELYVGTIHAFALELLKTEVPEYLKYEVLSDVQRMLLIDRSSQRSGLTTSTDLRGTALRRYTATKVYAQAMDILREDAYDEVLLANNSVRQGLDLYRELLRSKRLFDYASILEAAADILENDEAVRERVRGRIRHLIVDEYQDVNPVQERIVRALHDLGSTLCVVGDDDQTIYQWRGSDVQNIITFADRYPAVHRVALQENFRSSIGVIATAREFISQNQGRLAKQMESVDAQPFETGDVCSHHFQDPEAESAFIAETIAALRGVAIEEGGRARGLSYSDCAILLRSVRTNGDPVVAALQAASIPFVVVGMSELFRTAEVQASRLSFYFLAHDPATTVDHVRRAWQDANLGIATQSLDNMLEFLEETRQSLDESDDARWSLYSLQRTFLSMLESLKIYEDDVPSERGEIVLYNLGKFSQAISDFEQIHFHSAPRQKYESFAGFLRHQAEAYYAEGWQENQYANPDAVQIMTVHQAKGMQWPAVFMPALLRNRFPAAAVGGRTVWHLLPEAAFANSSRYRGGIEDERRLFYVGMTRAQKFLFLTYGPITGLNNRYSRPSAFYDNVLASRYVKRPRVMYDTRPRAAPEPRAAVSNVSLTFSDIKYFFECPYQFKMRILYGFNAPIHEALGFGKSLHDCLAEVHTRSIRGDVPTAIESAALVARHLHVPFAYSSLRDTLQRSAEAIVHEYLEKRSEDLNRLEHSEKSISIDLGDGVTVEGRIDLVRRLDTDEVSIVDLKTSERSQDEAVTERQLHTYALGYAELTGRNADFLEVYELDDQTRKTRTVDGDFLEQVQGDVRRAARSLQLSQLPHTPSSKTCSACDYSLLCPQSMAGDS